MKHYNWNDIYTKNAAKLLGICRRYVKDQALAEDIMHDAFIKAIQNIHSFKGLGSFEGWLRKLTINTALEYLRKNRTKEVVTTKMPEEIASTVFHQNDESIKTIIQTADFNEKELLATVEELPDHFKIVFNLYVIDNYKHHQIGEVLNISPGTSKSHLSRARKKIQQSLLEKAQLKSKEEKESKKGALFALLPLSDSSYIDALYTVLKSYEIPPSKKIDLRPIIQKYPQPTTTALTGASFGLLLTKIAVVAVTVTGVIALIYFSWLGFQNKKSVRIEAEKYKINDIPAANDSTLLNHPPIIRSLPVTNANKNSGKKIIKDSIERRVVIRKKIVVRDTVYISN